MKYTIVTFYRFVPLPYYYDMKKIILEKCDEYKIVGTILLAYEGINATIAGTNENIQKILDFLELDPKFQSISKKYSYNNYIPFQKMKVRLKSEIISLKQIHVMHKDSGEYVDPNDWDNVTNQKNTVVIDTRNDYEVGLGTFKKSINPKLTNFKDFYTWATKWANDVDKESTIAMFCTGGIRCEKSTALMKMLGFKNVKHLKGGILDYFEKTKNKNKQWQGNCFVFDDRIAVDDTLSRIHNILCTKCNKYTEVSDLQNVSRANILCKECC